MRAFERVTPETVQQRKILRQLQLENDPDVSIKRPRKGGSLWMGEDKAAEVNREVVNAADQNGQLRGIIEAVRSNRVVDDFSPCWSFPHEDSERKLYALRLSTTRKHPLHAPCCYNSIAACNAPGKPSNTVLSIAMLIVKDCLINSISIDDLALLTR